MNQPRPTIVVHGGAGPIALQRHTDFIEGCCLAIQAGWAVLVRGGSALDSVEEAVRIMEDDA